MDHELKPADLHVVAVFFNFFRFKKPVENFRRFERHMRDLGVTLHVVELVLRDMPFQVTDAGNPHHVQLRTQSEFFQKENLVNIGVRSIDKLYPEWKYVAWVDSDVQFFNEEVVLDTITALNRHPVVQMWSKAIDMAPDTTPIEQERFRKTAIVTSFAYAYSQGGEPDYQYGPYWHSGYAWAMRRDCFDALGGLYQHAILGAADHHMAWAFAGKPGEGVHGAASDGYKRDALEWLERAENVVRGDLGYVAGLIHHHWHGRKEDRKYVERWSILVDNGFDPAIDLVQDRTGLLRLTDRSRGLRDGVRRYFQQRNDDANTLA